MNKLLSTLGAIGGFIVILIAAGIGKMGGKVASEAILGPSDIIAATAREINRKAPMMVDTDTRLDSTTAGPGRVLAYNYTLVNYSASQLDTSLLAALERQVIEVSCSQQQQNLLSKHVAMRYRYASADGHLVRDFTINPNGCDNGQAPALAPAPAAVSVAPQRRAAPRPRAKAPEQERCEIKPVMTDHEIEVCRRR